MEQSEIKKTVLEFLNSHRKAVLATDGEDDHPTTSLMLYAVDDDLNIYFGTRKAFGKFKTFTRHPFASLTVVEEKLDPLKAVEIRGRIEFVPEERTAETLQWFESKNPSKYYVKGADDFVMFKVVPAFCKWMDASSGELVMEHLEFKG